MKYRDKLKKLRRLSSLWEATDSMLAEAQKGVEEMLKNNPDDYGLLNSAYKHIIAARGDLDADLK